MCGCFEIISDLFLRQLVGHILTLGRVMSMHVTRPSLLETRGH